MNYYFAKLERNMTKLAHWFENLCMYCIVKKILNLE